MNKQEFTHLLKNYNELSSDHIAMLKDIVKEYPYFSSANVLLAKAMSNNKHYEYEKQLKTTALVTGDRSVLYKIINNLPLKSVDEHQMMAEIPTALRVEKISKPDFIGIEEEIIEIEDLKFENKPFTIEEQPKTEIPISVEEVIDNIREEQIAKTEDISEITNSIFVESVIEKVETEAETEINHLTKWDGFQETLEEDKEELDEAEIAFDEELRNEAKLLKEESTHKDFLEMNMVPDDLKPEVNLAESTGTMLRFENIREDSLINLDDDDLLMDFDFGSLSDENQTLNVNPTTNYHVIVEEIIFENLAPIGSNENEEILNNTSGIETLSNETPEHLYNSIDSIQVEEIESDPINEIEPPLEILINIDEASSNTLTTSSVVHPEKEEDTTPISTPPSFESLLNVTDSEQNIETATIDESQTVFVENNSESQLETIELPIIETTLEVEDNIVEDETNEVEHIPNLEEIAKELDFMDWLESKKQDEIINVSIQTPIEKTNELIEVEEDEFTLTIRNLIRERAEKANIEDVQENDIFEKAADTTNTIVETVKEIIQNQQSTDEAELIENEKVDFEEKQESIHPFYGYEVKSVLPDFEQMVFHDVTNEETNENNSELQTKPTFEEEIDSKEAKLVFHPIHGLVPAEMDSEICDNIENNKTSTLIEKPFIEPWTETNEPFIQPIELEKEVAQDVLEKNDNNTESKETEEENNDSSLPTFETAKINENDFDNDFFAQYTRKITPNVPNLAFQQEIDQPKTIEQSVSEDSKTIIENELKESIIDKFIRENPNISRPKAEFYNPSNMAKMSAEEDDDLVSETLANVYAGQGLFKKAISTYEKLGLIYPHKMSYFAALINQLKTTHKIDS